jgi:hypothetical protein
VWRGVRRRALRPALLLGGLQTARLAEPPAELAVTNPGEARCPRCDSEHVLPIRYGYPGPKMVEDARAGVIALGGCVIFPNSPDHRYDNCGHEWRVFTTLH